MEFELLDHGYLKLVERWGSDQSIIEAARMSTNKGFLGWQDERSCVKCGVGYVHAFNRETGECWPPGNDKGRACAESGGHEWEGHPGDEKLLAYLWRNKHSTPFEMAGLTIEVQAPIFVFREWHRHRVPFGYNEMSARYTPLPDLNYVPTVERLMMGGGHLTKQAGTIKGAEQLTIEVVDFYRAKLRQEYENDQRFYEEALKMGVPKELARVHLPVGRYSRMRATGNLRGWLAFMTLRAAKNAQYEIRVYAEALGKVLEKEFPRTWELFAEGRP